MGNICLHVTGPAGIGKSLLCKHVCTTWCQAHDPSVLKANKYLPEDIETMKNFDFLFLVHEDIDTLKQFFFSPCDRSQRGVNVKEHSYLFLIDDVDYKQELLSMILGLEYGFERNKGRCTIIVTSDGPALSTFNFPCRSVVMQNLDSKSSAELVTKQRIFYLIDTRLRNQMYQLRTSISTCPLLVSTETNYFQS
jgi:hypothetical protein